MDFELTKLTETLESGIKEVGEGIEKTAAAFHDQFVSKVIPTDGKFGEAVTFATEMIPGVAAFNSICEGDWQQAAIDITLDVGMVVVGAVTAGTGAVAIASARTASKVAIKGAGEVVETVAKTAIKESAETVTKTVARETTETMTKTLTHEGTETLVEQTAKETTETVVEKSGKILTDGTHLENGKLRADVTYKSGEHDYLYKTDSEGRIVSAQAQTLKLKTHENRLPHNSETPGKIQGEDHAGHLLGDRFGGSGELDNLVSQAKNVNLKEYKAIENEWAKALESGRSVNQVGIQVKYNQGEVRPSAFDIHYDIDGEHFFKPIYQ